jgi:hypothetical protein
MAPKELRAPPSGSSAWFLARRQIAACHIADPRSNLFACVDVANTALVTAPTLTCARSRANSPA